MVKKIGRFTVYKGTAAAESIDVLKRQPALYIHENKEEYADCIIFGEYDIDTLEEEDIDVLLYNEPVSFYQEDLDSFSEKPEPSKTFTLNIGNYRVTVKAESRLGLEDDDTEYFLNDLSLVYQYAAEYCKQHDMEAISPDYEDSSNNVYDFLKDMDFYEEEEKI